MKKLSVAIVTFNEEENISECIKSAAFADEVVVVDGKSTDKTAVIAKKLGAKVYSEVNQPLMKVNMNLAFGKCGGEWIFSLDADERVTEELANEIKSVVVNGQDIAYRVPRKNMIFGKWMEHSGWYPDYQLRLFRKGKARFPADNVHEELMVDGSVGNLNNAIIHWHYRGISEWLLRTDRYTSLEANKLIKEGYKVKWSDGIWFPVRQFLTRFFDWEGYKDGLHGLVLSILNACYWEIVFAKVWEHEGFWTYGGEEFLDEVNQQEREVSRHWRHWMIMSENKPLKRLAKKISNKIWQK